MDFSPDAVLDLGPQPHRRGTHFIQRAFVLWPAWAWRVVVPQGRKTTLNPLQRAVLRLCASGLRTYEDIAAPLGLDRALIAYIGGELTSKGALARDGQVTERGLSLLDGDLPELTELKTSWVFHDDIGDRLFPRLAPELILAQVESNEAGRPLITTGPKGRPHTRQAFVIRHHRGPPPPPGPRELIDAARRHRRHAKRSRRSGLTVPSVPEDYQERFSCLSDSPRRVHLLTYVYVPDKGDDDRLWYIADPFGLGASEEMARSLESMIEGAEGGLRDHLESITGARLKEHRAQFEAAQKLLGDEAQKAVDRTLPRLSSLDDAVLREALLQAHTERLRLQLRGPRAEAQGQDTVYLRIRQAIEAALLLTLERHPPGEAWRRVGEMGRDLLQATLKQAARGVGFPPKDLPRALLRAKAKDIEYVCKGSPKGKMRAILATLLLAAQVEDHPLFRIARVNSDWLNQLDALLTTANDAIHASLHRPPKGANLDEDLKTTGALMKTLLEALAGPSSEDRRG